MLLCWVDWTELQKTLLGFIDTFSPLDFAIENYQKLFRLCTKGVANSSWNKTSTSSKSSFKVKFTLSPQNIEVIRKETNLSRKVAAHLGTLADFLHTKTQKRLLFKNVFLWKNLNFLTHPLYPMLQPSFRKKKALRSFSAESKHHSLRQ